MRKPERTDRRSRKVVDTTPERVNLMKRMRHCLLVQTLQEEVEIEADLEEAEEEAMEAAGELESLVLVWLNAGTAGRKVISNIIVLIQRKKTH